jgi:predicted outer membrane repeat protein
LHGSIVVSNCTFAGNSAGLAGGGICHWYTTGSATILDCGFVGNSATLGGGALAAGACTLTVSGSTFAGNSALLGGAVANQCNTGTLERTTIAFNSAGGAVACQGGNSPTLGCCDIYGNVGGDWVGCISDQYGTNGNFSADPLFCDPGNDDYHLLEASPCGPQQQPVCGLIGAHEVGCCAGTPIPEDEPPGKQPLLTIGPNPFETVSLIMYEVPGEYGTLPVALKIYDATGRHVRTLLEGPQHVGRHVAVWDGLDSEGHVQPPGIYFCRLWAGEWALTRKLVRIR